MQVQGYQALAKTACSPAHQRIAIAAAAVSTPINALLPNDNNVD